MSALSKFNWRSFDWSLLVAVFLLAAIGLTAIYSIDLSGGEELLFLKKQSIALAIGLILFTAASLAQPSFFRVYAKFFYGLCLLLLLGVLLFGHTIRGTTGWFVLARFNFQPVELVKLGLILIMSYIIAGFGRRFERPLFFFGTGAVALAAIGLVLLQPDLGSAVILGIIWFGMIVIVGVRRAYIFGFLLAAMATAVLLWFFFLQPYQKDRILTFIDPSRDPLRAGYNVSQAMIAIGSGQWLGRGLGFGSQSQLKFLPESQTDFIFSAIGEEMGFVGAAAMITIFSFMLWRLINIARRSGSDFGAAVATGTAIAMFAQFVINVGANLGLLPVTGVTLPFVSYGGSSLVVNLLMIGVVESMVVRRY